MDRPDHNTYAGDSVPVSWLGGETTNRLSGDAVDGSVSVASAPDSEARLIDVEDSITLDVPEIVRSVVGS